MAAEDSNQSQKPQQDQQDQQSQPQPQQEQQEQPQSLPQQEQHPEPQQHQQQAQPEQQQAPQPQQQQSQAQPQIPNLTPEQTAQYHQYLQHYASQYPGGQIPPGCEEHAHQYAAYYIALAAQQQAAQSQSYSATPAVPEYKRAHLYVGNLCPNVTEVLLQDIFSTAGPVLGVKIIPDRSHQHPPSNYGFVEYHDMKSAETALLTLNGRRILQNNIRVNWAYQNTQNAVKEDLSGHFHVFVGDLSPEVKDDILGKAFSAFGSLSDARVMWDMNSGKSRGYGFLAFRDKTDAEQAIATMNGEWLGSRAIRVNWANQKNQGMAGLPVAMGVPNVGPMGASTNTGPMSYETVVAQTPSYNSTVYTGNLVPYCTQADLIPLFQGFGYIVEIRMQADRGFAFVKLDTHENAAMAIVNLTGTPVHGRPLKCSWGKDKASGDPNAVATPGVGMVPAYYGVQGVQPNYGMAHAQPGYPVVPASYGYGYGQTQTAH